MLQVVRDHGEQALLSQFRGEGGHGGREGERLHDNTSQAKQAISLEATNPTHLFTKVVHSLPNEESSIALWSFGSALAQQLTRSRTLARGAQRGG